MHLFQTFMSPNQKPDSCLICNRISLIKKRKNPYFVAETTSGYIVLGDHQFFRGYTLFLSKDHKRELHELEPEMRKTFLWEMSEVAAAVIRAFQPVKLNYELLGNTDEHLHWHLVCRHRDDPNLHGPAWNIDPKIQKAPATIPDAQTLKVMKRQLLTELIKSPELKLARHTGKS